MKRQRQAEPQIVFALHQAEGGTPVSAICQREGVHSTVYDRWTRDVLETMRRLCGWRVLRLRRVLRLVGAEP